MKGLEEPEDILDDTSHSDELDNAPINEEQRLKGETDDSQLVENSYQSKKLDKLSEDQTNITRVTGVVDGKKKSKYLCNQCDYESTQTTNVKVHIETKHEKRKYGCSECEKECNSVASLLYHKKTKHDGFRITCTFCDHKFTTPQGLKVHMTNIHS